MFVSLRPYQGKRWIALPKNGKAMKRGAAFWPVLEILEDRTLMSSGPSAFGHITNGRFDMINGHQEWSDIQPSFFASTQSYLYADQANLNHPPGSVPDTFMLMYDEVGLTTPLGHNQFFTVGFTTVEHENGHDRLNQYSIHIYTDGTITFLENGAVQTDASGNSRVVTIGGQQGQAGFGSSPNSSTPHVIAEFQIALSANQTVLNGGYSPDPQFWTSDPPPPPPPPPPPDLKISFYVKSPYNDTIDIPLIPGHAFVQMIPNIGPQAGDKNLAYGKHPDGWNPISGGGDIHDESTHQWDWRITFPVTADQYNAVANFISNQIDNPSDYNLFNSNCTDWVSQIASIAGLTLPETHDRLGYSDPFAFEQSLTEIGNGGTFGDGKILENTTGVLPNGAPDPPQTQPDPGGVEGLVVNALHDPAGLAQAFNLQFQQQTLSTVSVATGQSLTVSLGNVALTQAVVVVDFGDGSPTEQSLNATHAYQTPGTRQARAIVINGGALDEYLFNVDVGSTSGPGTVAISVPSAPINELFPPSPAPAGPLSIPNLHLAHVSAFIGDSVGFSIQGFHPNSSFTLVLGSQQVSSGTLDPTGAFLGTFTVPSLPFGDTNLQAQDAFGTSATTVFEVLPPFGTSAVLPGFDAHLLPGNDDGSTGAVPLGFTVNFFGHNYSSLFVNNNGNVTFDAPLSTFTPFSLTSTGRVIIAPFFADVDTRVGNVVTYGTGTVGGHAAFGVTWPGVGYFSAHTNKLNTFQVVLIDRSDTGAGNFDIDFNYGQIQWETGDASGGVNGLGGSSARVGFSNGTGQPGTFFELPGSGVHGAFLDSNTQTGLIHIPPQVFSVRSGAPEEHTTAAFLQANLDGTTTVEPHSVLIGQEPTLTDEIERIVEFRVQAGLTNSPAQLTNELVQGLIEDGIISPQQGNQIITTVLQQFPTDAPITVTLRPPSPVEGAPLSNVVVATLHDADPAGRATDFTATITWGDGGTSTATAALGTIVENSDGSFSIIGNHTYTEEAINLTFTVQVQDVGGSQDSKSTTLSVTDPPVLAAGVPVLAFECRPFTTVPVATFTDPGGAEPVGDYLVVINWGDSSVSSVAPTFSAGTFTVSGGHTYAEEGSYTITVSINHEGILTTATTTATVKDNLGLLVLDPSGSAVLTVTGNGGVTVNNCGAVVVNSSSATAATLTGNGNVSAMDIDVTGGSKVTGKGAFSTTIDHEAANPDPIGLSLPPAPSATFLAVNYSGSAPLPLSPGTYVGGIKISGQGSVVLSPGIYYLKGGGFTLSGKGSVTGAGVLLVNAPASPKDSINISGDGGLILQSPPTSLTGALSAFNGVTILQDPASSAPINISGKGGLSVEGIVYARGGALNITGDGSMTVNSDSPNHIEGEVVVFHVSLTGNGGLTINADGASSVSLAGSIPSGGGLLGPAAIAGALTQSLSNFVWLDYQAFVSASVANKRDFGGSVPITPQAAQDTALNLLLQGLSTVGVNNSNDLASLELAVVDRIFAALAP